MKSRSTAAIVLLAFAIGLATVSAHAQGMGGLGGGMGGGGHKHQRSKAYPTNRLTHGRVHAEAIGSPGDFTAFDHRRRKSYAMTAPLAASLSCCDLKLCCQKNL